MFHEPIWNIFLVDRTAFSLWTVLASLPPASDKAWLWPKPKINEDGVIDAGELNATDADAALDKLVRKSRS